MVKFTSVFAATACFVLALLASSSVFAAPPPAPVFNWTGFYVGGNFGIVAARFKGSDTTVETYGSGEGVGGGIQGGYSRQLESIPIVLGAEIDFFGSSLEAGASTASFVEPWTSTFRGRVGYAIGGFVPFITGGLALTGTEWTINGTGSRSEVAVGHAYGGGADFHCPEMGRWTGRFEYLHVDVPRIVSNVNGTLATAGSGNNVVRIGANFNF